MQLNFSLNILLSGISQSPESKLYEYNKYNELSKVLARGITGGPSG